MRQHVQLDVRRARPVGRHPERHGHHHDGTPMTTADVIYSLKRNLNPNSYWFFAFTNVKSIDQTGPWEVTVRMKKADVTFPGLMSTPAGGIGPEAYLKAKGKNYGTPGA